MAEKAVVVAEVNKLANVSSFTWEALAKGDTGAPVSFPHYQDKTFQAVGSFDSATLTMQGSNDGTNWFTLKNHADADVASTAATIGHVIVQNPLWVRPSLSGSGGSADVDVIVIARQGAR